MENLKEPICKKNGYDVIKPFQNKITGHLVSRHVINVVYSMGIPDILVTKDELNAVHKKR